MLEKSSVVLRWWVLHLGLAALLLGMGIGCRRTPTIERDGGVRLVYAIDAERIDEDGIAGIDVDSTQELPDLPGALLRRLHEYRGASVKAINDTEFEIIVPGVREEEGPHIKEIISSRAALRFQIVANPDDHAAAIALARATDEEIVHNADGEKVARWVNAGFEPGTVREYRAIDPTNILRGRRDGDAYEPIELPGDVQLNVLRDEITLAEVLDQLGFRDVQVLVVLEPKGLNIHDLHLRTASKGYDDASNPAVYFTMKPDGAKLLERITSDNLPVGDRYRQMGMIFDDVLVSAPRINGTIGRDGQITGNFTDEEVDFMVYLLRAGRLPAVLQREPSSEEWFAPKSSETAR